MALVEQGALCRAHLDVALPNFEAGDLAESEHLFEPDPADHLLKDTPDFVRVRIYLTPLCRLCRLCR